MKFGVVIFPGSNCEQDVIRATQYLGYQSEYIWHGDTDISGFDAIVLPGGFSYGDYIRTGAVARFSPVMSEVIRFAEKGGPVPGYDETPVAKHMAGRDIHIAVDLGIGRGRSTVWTCDLTHRYIDINGSYRS